jgi:quinoprotein glucose dehydrogenase
MMNVHRHNNNGLKGLALLLVAGAAWGTLARAQGQKDVEWKTYTADTKGTRYLPLDQINASNFDKLEVAWRFKTDNLGTRPEYKLEGTPIMVDGVVYATAGTRRSVVALAAQSGELLWVHGEHEGERAAASPRQLSGRGLAYWTDGKESRIVYVTPGYRLLELDAKTGTPVASFGTNGAIDLKQNDDQVIDPMNDQIGFQSAPTVSNDVIIIGGAGREGGTPKSYKNVKLYVRGFDARTGKRLWIFHTIPQKGEPGYDTWLNGSAEYTGNTGVWTETTVDPDLGLAYLPVESPTSDYYGGRRPGNNLFGESLVCVDVKTGKMKWYFQLDHHPLWDMDISSPPILADVNVDGKPMKVVAQPTKQGILYVFDRVTGKPVWPMPETPVEKGSVPGEWYSPTEPIPTKPPAYARNGVSLDDLIDFTPALHDAAVKTVSKYKIGPIFTPAVVSNINGPIATLTLGTAAGGTNWPGGSYDPETHNVYVYASNALLYPLSLVKTPAGLSDIDYVQGVDGQRVEIARGPGELAGADSKPDSAPAPTNNGPNPLAALYPGGLPLIKPPYGTISAINLDKGEIVWQIAHGETPDFVRNHPALKGLNIPRTGQPGYDTGTMVTKSLVVAGDGMVTTTADHPRGAMLRAYDKMTGKEVGRVFLPAPESGSPMTYMVNGKQYIVVAVSGGNYSGEYIAFSLPSVP